MMGCLLSDPDYDGFARGQQIRAWARRTVAARNEAPREQSQREAAFIAGLKPKPDVAGNPSESVNVPLLEQIKQARSLLVDEVQR